MRFTGTQSYVATPDLMVAVNAAIALQRPLLVKGEPGTGKTILAHEVAAALGRPLIEWHVKSTTKAQHGLYEYDAVARLRESGVDGVMIAREALARPWIFAQTAALLRGEPLPPDPSLAEQKELVLHHYDLVCRRFGIERGTLLMRKFACAYAQGLAGAREFRGRVSRVETREAFLEVMRVHFPSVQASQQGTA